MDKDFNIKIKREGDLNTNNNLEDSQSSKLFNTNYFMSSYKFLTEL